MFKSKLEVDKHVENCLKKINNETEVSMPLTFLLTAITGLFLDRGVTYMHFLNNILNDLTFLI